MKTEDLALLSPAQLAAYVKIQAWRRKRDANKTNTKGK
jgi:hypothetical protein